MSWLASPAKVAPPAMTKQQQILSRENSVRERLTRKTSSLESSTSSTPSLTRSTSIPLVRRQKSFRAEFIEIYVGSQCFQGDNLLLNVVLAVYLLASERLYEVVILNADTAVELHRIYVYEEELVYQMEGRLAALTAARDAPPVVKKPTSKRIVPTDSPVALEDQEKEREKEKSPLTASPSVTNSPTTPVGSQRIPMVARRDGKSRRVSVELQNAGSNRVSTEELSARMRRSEQDSESRSRRMSIGGDENGVSVERKNRVGRRESEDVSSARFKSARLPSEGQGKQTTKSQRRSYEFTDFSKDEELMNITSFTSRYSSRTNRTIPRVRNPETYFELIHGTHIVPEIDDYKKFSLSELREDFSKLEQDICNTSAKGISFFVAVILNFIYVRRQSKNNELFHFILFDGEARSIFNILDKLPANCEDSTATTEVDPQTMITEFKEMREWLESCTSGISSAQQLVDKAQVLQGGTQGVIVGDGAGTSRQPAHDGVNPNKNYFGNMWRDAFHKVGQKLQNHKLIRAHWQSVIDQSKAAKAEEDFMTQQIQAVKFRSLAVGGNGRGGVSLKDMASYRQNLTSKKTKAAS